MKPVAIAVTCASISLVAFLACNRQADAPRDKAAGSTAETTPAAELKLALPFIENDYTAALAKAREAKLPLFVEVWAPW